MSGRQYDLSNKATCKKCGSDMLLSSERNFNGPECKNEDCDGGTLEAEYEPPTIFDEYYKDTWINQHLGIAGFKKTKKDK